MDERMARTQLDEVKKELLRNEEEHEVLLSLLKGYEGWLRLHVSHNGVAKEPSPQLLMPVPVEADGAKPTWQPTIRRVVKEARGEPIHSKEIWERAQALGLRTKGKNPLGLVDLNIKRIREIQKAGPRLWKWVGNSNS